MNKLRPIKNYAIIAAVLLLAISAYGASIWRPCSGWRGCYFSWRLFNNGTSQLEGERQRAIYQFTASLRSVAFPVPLTTGTMGLLFVDRATRQQRLISEDGVSFYTPHLSWDNERLLFVRYERGQRELLSCVVRTWRCRVVVRTDNSVSSPVEIDKNSIVYSSSPLVLGADNRKRYSRHDIYLAKDGSDPIRMTDFELYELDSIGVSGDKVIFSAFGPRPEKPVIPISDALASSRSEVFELKIDEDGQHISLPTNALKSRFLVDGLSVKPSVSKNGEKIAFLNTSAGSGTYRYNLMVVDVASARRKLIALKGIAFSPGAFVGDTLVYNELFSDRYRVSAWNSASDTVHPVVDIKFADINPENLERITLRLDAASGGRKQE